MRYLVFILLAITASGCVHKSHEESNDALNNKYYSDYVLAYQAYGKIPLDSTLHAIQLYLEKFPDNSKALTFMARVYVDKQDLAKAEECYKKAITTDAQNGAALAALGTLYSWDGRYDSALMLIDKAIAVGDSDNYCFLNRAIISIKKNDISSAQKVTTHFVQLDTMDNQLLAHLAVVQKVLKNEGGMNQAVAILGKRNVTDTLLNRCLKEHISALEFFEQKRKLTTHAK